MNKGKRNFKGMLMGFTETMNVQNCVTFVYSIEFAWLTTHVNLFHLGGRRKKTGQVTYQVMVMEVKTEKS